MKVSNIRSQLLLALPLIGAVALIAGLVFFSGDLRYLLSAKEDVSITSQDGRLVEMVTVLSRDAIPSIDNPRFVSADRANYASDELVIGVEVNGEARAYSIPLLSRHEIVNDTIQGRHIAVTW